MKQYLYLSSCLLALSLLSSCQKEKSAAAVQSVEVITPQNSQAIENKVLSGVVKENNTLNLSFEAAGKIEAVLVREGDYVHAGQVIARLDAKDYRLGVAALQAQYDMQKRDTERKRAMHEQNAMSGNEYEHAKSALEQLEAQLQANKNKLSYTQLKSPASGYIQTVSMHKGEMVNAGTGIATLVDLSAMEVELSLPASVYQQREQFGQVTCAAASNPDKQYTLNSMSAVVKSDGNQLYRVKFVISAKDGKELAAGTNVEVHIPIRDAQAQPGILLPPAAVCQEAGQTYVYIVSSKDLLQKQPVQIIRLQGDFILVKNNLPSRVRIVKAGISTLHPGQKVRVVNVESKTNKGGLI